MRPAYDPAHTSQRVPSSLGIGIVRCLRSQRVGSRVLRAIVAIASALLVHVLIDPQNAALRFEHEFFLLAQWLLLVKQACYLIKRVMRTTACLVLLRGWQYHIGNLHKR